MAFTCVHDILKGFGFFFIIMGHDCFECCNGICFVMYVACFVHSLRKAEYISVWYVLHDFMTVILSIEYIMVRCLHILQ